MEYANDNCPDAARYDRGDCCGGHCAPTNAGALAFASVCSGIEAASVAFNPLGWRAVCFSEIEKFPSAVLTHHYPDVPNLGDFTKIDTTTLGRVDILCGGTPCQAFSVAGLRQSLDDARGNLSLEFVRLAHELTDGNGLRNVIWENVPGVLSTKDNAFGCFLAGLVGAADALPPPKGRRWPNAGMVAGPKGRAAWRVLDAQYFGLAQRRKRVIVVADFGNGADPAAVLFEPESVRRDSPPSRETRQTTTSPIAPSLTASGRGVERTGDTRGQVPVVAVFDRQSNCEYGEQNLASTVSARDYKSPTDLVAVGVTGPISHALKAEGADGSEDGTGRGTPIVTVMHETGQGWWKQDDVAGTLRAEGENRPSRPSHVIAFSAKDYGVDASTDLAPTLRAGGHTTSHANAGVMPAIAFQSVDFGADASAELSPTLRRHDPMAVCTVALRGREGGATAELGGEVATALRASSGGGDKPHVLTSAVRRLTPRECERLQGFQFLCSPDYPGAWLDDAGRWWSPDYTAIPYNKVSEAKIDADWIKYMARGNPKNLTRADVARLAADGPRYKSLGNSWAVPKFRWLGERIAKHMPPIAVNDNNKQDIARAA